jgi:ketosteroid isomerase-like protein
MSESIDRDGEIKAVEAAIKGSMEWCLPEKDRQRCFAYSLKDSSFFMYQPSSNATCNGFAAFEDYAERILFDDRLKPLYIDYKELEIQLSPHGDVAWFRALIDDVGEWDGHQAGWMDCRWTGVLVKRDGAWVIAQQHFSLASDKVREEALAAAEES